MYLHLGGDIVIKQQDIVGMFDIENTTVCAITKQYLKYSEDRMWITTVSEDIPRSFIVTHSPYGIRVYLSPISCATLVRRASRSIAEVCNGFPNL